MKFMFSATKGIVTLLSLLTKSQGHVSLFLKTRKENHISV